MQNIPFQANVGANCDFTHCFNTESGPKYKIGYVTSHIESLFASAWAGYCLLLIGFVYCTYHKTDRLTIEDGRTWGMEGKSLKHNGVQLILVNHRPKMDPSDVINVSGFPTLNGVNQVGIDELVCIFKALHKTRHQQCTDHMVGSAVMNTGME